MDSLKDVHMVELGKRIEEKRKECELTREVMDRAMGKPQGFMAGVEEGKIDMMAEDLYMVVQLLGVSSDYLLTGKEFNAEDAGAADGTHSVHHENFTKNS